MAMEEQGGMWICGCQPLIPNQVIAVYSSDWSHGGKGSDAPKSKVVMVVLADMKFPLGSSRRKAAMVWQRRW